MGERDLGFETHLDLSSTQPNRPTDFFAHGSGWKAGLKIVSKTPGFSPNRRCLPGQAEREERQIGGAW
jgi:hypothetical protein